MAIPNQSFSMYSGNSRRIEVTITDTRGKASDLTGASAYWTLADKGIPLLQKSTDNFISITSHTGGVLDIVLNSEDTQDLSGDYDHELKIKDANGHLYTVLRGTVSIERSLKSDLV